MNEKPKRKRRPAPRWPLLVSALVLALSVFYCILSVELPYMSTIILADVYRAVGQVLGVFLTNVGLIIGILLIIALAWFSRRLEVGARIVVLWLLAALLLFGAAFVAGWGTHATIVESVDLDGRTYYLKRHSSLDTVRHTVFACGSLDILCETIYETPLDTYWWDGLSLRADADASTLDILHDDEVVYTYHTAD